MERRSCMTSGNVTSVSPNLMVNNQLSAKDGDKSGGFLDVMSKNVAKSDKKADTQNQVSGNDVKDDKAKVNNTKAQTPDDKKVTTKDNKADKDVKIYREEIYLQIKLANLMGTTSKVSEIDSVNELIKDITNLNDKKIDALNVQDEVLVEENRPQSIRINKRHE